MPPFSSLLAGPSIFDPLVSYGPTTQNQKSKETKNTHTHSKEQDHGMFMGLVFFMRKQISCIFLLFLFLLFLLVSGRSAEEWRLATATYIKESQSHSLNGGGACGYGDLHLAGYGKNTAGLSSALFGRGSACGGCFELRCVNHILWCLRGSPSITVTVTDFCAPNFSLPDDYGGWCNFPKEHFEMSEAAFLQIAKRKADIVPVQYRRVRCDRTGGIRFMITGSSYFHQVLITNVAADGEVVAVKVKGSTTAWIPMGRNWGQNWQCDADLRAQPLSFEVTSRNGRTVASYNVAHSGWRFGQTFEGRQFLQ